ncbi:MAG: TIGR02147 family protein [Bdellovibrionales bacterium CG10_big_fil_rev_8_21_14_0_10_45_34]|nr:MAG: TIGR02147 family protein [Bdellovibrionales bacterium CG10_big_fil_rev_8_21_14_0_10_45_34]
MELDQHAERVTEGSKVLADQGIVSQTVAPGLQQQQPERRSKTVLDKMKREGLSFSESAPVISGYFNYRDFLKDFYNYKRTSEKLGRRSYTYAVFAAAADIKSPNYLKLIMDGDRNLSADMIKKFARALGLSKRDVRDFDLLVNYTQQSDPVVKAKHLKDLLQHRIESQVLDGQLSGEAAKSVPSWLSWVVYQMMDLEFSDVNPEQIQKRLRVKPGVSQFEKAIESLIFGGLLEKEESGVLKRRTNKHLEDPNRLPPEVVKKLQTELILLGLESLFEDPNDKKDFGTATLCLTQTEFENLRADLRRLRKKWLMNIGVNRETSKGEVVYQLNTQIFPLTR